MKPPFVGVLCTAHRKHLLVNCRLRKTACDKIMKTGKVYEAYFNELALWNDEAPVQCPKCAAKYAEWKKQKGETDEVAEG